MAFEIPGFSFTLVAAADLSTSQFRAVNVSAAGKAALPSAGGRIVGILQNKPLINEAATIVHDGISIVESGAAITAGDLVAVDNTGKLKAVATGNEIIGIALETASGTGIRIAVLLTPAARVG